MLGCDKIDRFCLRKRRNFNQSHDAGVVLSPQKNQLTEVFVQGDQNTFLFDGPPQNDFVAGVRR